MTYAEALLQDQQPHVAEQVLRSRASASRATPTCGTCSPRCRACQANILGLHQSRAEYFILNGILDQAEKQLRYALKLVRDDYTTAARINQRLADIGQMRELLES
jgi:predicted Zn-dependent protease